MRRCIFNAFSTSLSPGMNQYRSLKAQCGSHLLMFQLGDFFELFGADAEKASALLGITLTQRRSSSKGGDAVPMCGVPVSSVDGYLGKLLRMGQTVAVAEQVE